MNILFFGNTLPNIPQIYATFALNYPYNGRDFFRTQYIVKNREPG